MTTNDVSDTRIEAFVSYGPLRSYEHEALMDRILGPVLESLEEVRDARGNLTGWKLTLASRTQSPAEWQVEAAARAFDPHAFKTWQQSYDYEMGQSGNADEAKAFADWSMGKRIEEVRAAAREALRAASITPPAPEHPDDLAVDRFAAAMKAKLAKKRAEVRGGWENKDECSAEFLSSLLHGHVIKGDPVDVANLAMMLHQRGESIVDTKNSAEFNPRGSDFVFSGRTPPAPERSKEEVDAVAQAAFEREALPFGHPDCRFYKDGFGRPVRYPGGLTAAEWDSGPARSSALRAADLPED